MNRKHLIYIAALFLAGVVSSRGAVIDTTGGWGGTTGLGGFGTGSSAATWGQTFTVSGTETILESFVLYTSASSGTASKFSAYIMEWNVTNHRATGSSLFTSVETIVPFTSANPRPVVTHTFTPGITLETGKSYVFFLNVSPSFSETGFDNGSMSFGQPSPPNYYPDGESVYLYNGADLSRLTTEEWGRIPGGSVDIAFRAVLVPEPSAPLFSLSALGFLLYRRNR